MQSPIRAQLIIGPIDGESEKSPEHDGDNVLIEVGVPRGRLQATGPGGQKMWLRLHVEDPFSPDVIAPTVEEVEEGIRWIQVPGLTPANEPAQWHLYADHTFCG